jgi:hypothetical protein
VITETPPTKTTSDWRRMHALGLPAGSVRALLAILIFGTVWALLALRPNQEVPDYLRDLLFIIMGHYFASRHRATNVDEAGPPPLYLPRGSVRLILVLGCVAVGMLLYRRGQLTALEENPASITLLLVGGFLLGVSLNAVFTWWKERGHKPLRILEDLRALISMAAAVVLIAMVLNRLFVFIAPDRVDALFAGWIRLGRFGPEKLLAAVVGFYFGSRS